MTPIKLRKRPFMLAIYLVFLFGLTACTAGSFSDSPGLKNQVTPYAPGINQRKDAQDGIEVAHRLMQAGEYELAIRAFNRAALATSLDAEILSGLGSANLGLGRLGQAEDLLRSAVEIDGTRPEVWNNLGVVLMERGKLA